MNIKINEQSFTISDIEQKLLTMALSARIPASKALDGTNLIISLLSVSDQKLTNEGFVIKDALESLVLAAMQGSKEEREKCNRQYSELLRNSGDLMNTLH